MTKRRVRKVEQKDIYIDKGDCFSFWLSIIFGGAQAAIFYVYYLTLKVVGFFCGFNIWLAVRVEEEHTELDMLKLEDGDKFI